jgi:NCAIR mutase (PurE)-related protein
MTGEFKLDFDRGARVGLDEALFCESKTVDQIAAIVEAVKAKTGRLLLTRLDRSKHEALVARHVAGLEFDSLSRTAILGKPHAGLRVAPVAIVMAGTSDLSAGREAARTLLFAGQPYREYTDIGVAGLWRLLERIDEIRLSPVVIVAAGMDAALVSVVGGLIPGAVIALPTSVGYGVARGGETALHAALVSCAPGITAVNIDNGYGAASAALRISRAIAASQNAAERIAATAKGEPDSPRASS